MSPESNKNDIMDPKSYLLACIVIENLEIFVSIMYMYEVCVNYLILNFYVPLREFCVL